MEVRAHVLKGDRQISISDVSPRLCRLSYHRILHVRPRKRGAEGQDQQIPSVPILSDSNSKMWVHWGSMLSILIAVLLGRAGLLPFLRPDRLRRSCTVAEVMQSCRTLWQQDSRFWTLFCCQVSACTLATARTITYVQICLKEEALWQQLESGGVKPNLQTYQLSSAKDYWRDRESVRHESTEIRGF